MKHFISKNLTRSDIALIIILILIVIALLFYFFLTRSSQHVEIYYADKLLHTYALDNDRVIEIDDMIIEIRNGQVRVKESNCKRQICVKQGWSNNLPIICAPNKVAVVIRSKQDSLLITR